MQDMKPDTLPEHTSPEMAKLIVKFEQAKYKDSVLRDKYSKLVKSLEDENRAIKDKILAGEHWLELKVIPRDPGYPNINSVRRRIRYRLFRIREGGPRLPEFDKGLKSWMELQFQPGMTWAAFTFTWDVSPTEPLKVITPFEWESSGGKIVDGFCEPPAFTKQEM